MAGAGAGSFGAGFAKGLANVFLANRQEQTRKREREEDVKFRNLQSVAPIMAQNFFANPTPEGAAALEDFYAQINPELAKSIKRTGFSFETLGPFLSQAPAQSTEIIPGTTGIPRQVDAAGQPTQIQARGATFTQPDPTARLFGTPVQSPEQRTAAMGEAEIQGKVQAARRLLSTGAAKTMAEALDRVGLRQTTSTAAGMQSIPGTLADGTPAFAVFNRMTGQYINPDTGEPLQGFRPRATGATDLGDLTETAARELGFANADAAARAGKMREVTTRAQELAGGFSQERREGTGRGALNSPITPEQAKDLPGATIGTPGSAYTGQQPATVQQAERRRNAEAIKAQIPKIATAVDAALPSENEIAGLAPNLSNALRQRFFKERRNQYAQLEAEINNIRSLLVRTLQQNVGTETELDAQRALSTLAQFQGSLWDPAGGDTRESAKIRLTSTLAFIDRILEEAPRPLTTPATAGATGARTGAPEPGKPYQDERGNWIIP